MSAEELLPITKELYNQMQMIAWTMLGPLFILSCTIRYMKEPHCFPALEMIHRVFITIALLMSFPEITKLISDVANSLSEAKQRSVFHDEIEGLQLNLALTLGAPPDANDREFTRLHANFCRNIEHF